MVVDSLRPDFLGVYNPQVSLTPNLNKIAETGTVFEHVFAQANWTYPSLYSLLTGLYPSRFNITFFNQKIDAPNRIIPELLSKKGFRTAIFSSFKTLINPKTFGSHFSERRLASAIDSDILEFQKWIGSIGSNQDYFIMYHLGDYTHVPYCVPDEFISAETKRDDIKNKNLQTLIRKTSDSGTIKNIFKRVNAHLLKLKPEELNLLKECYAGGVKYIDRFIGKFYESLLENEQDFLFVLVADHGEGFFEHGIIGHGMGIYNEIIKIPMIITGQSFIKQRVEQPVQLIDLYPTICSIVGIDTSQLILDGMNLFDRIQGKTDEVICDAYPLIAMIDGPYKLISSHIKFKSRKNIYKEFISIVAERKWGRLAYWLHSLLKKDVLYDYKEDPQERKNIRKKNPDVYKKLRTIITDYLSHKTDITLKLGDVDLDDELISRLKGLGYM